MSEIADFFGCLFHACFFVPATLFSMPLLCVGHDDVSFFHFLAVARQEVLGALTSEPREELSIPVSNSTREHASHASSLSRMAAHWFALKPCEEHLGTGELLGVPSLSSQSPRGRLLAMFWFATEPVFHSSVHEGAFHSLHPRGGCTKCCLLPGLQVYDTSRV